MCDSIPFGKFPICHDCARYHLLAGNPTLALHAVQDPSSKLKKMQGETAKLADLAKGGDFAAIKLQFGETGKGCKAVKSDQ